MYYNKSHSTQGITSSQKEGSGRQLTQRRQSTSKRRGKDTYLKYPLPDTILGSDKCISRSVLADLKRVFEPYREASSGAYLRKWEYLFEELLSKHDSLEGPESSDPLTKRNRAIEKMLQSELSCAEYNKLRYASATNPLWAKAREVIRHILGPWTYGIFERSAFTSGATTSHKRLNGHPFNKYDVEQRIDVTPDCYPYAVALIRTTPGWAARGAAWSLFECDSNKITTVPKNSKIDRCIAIEPDMNQCLQKAVGSYIRDRLRSVAGIDLKDQTRNQRLSWDGSRTGFFATIDLASASDSLSRMLVWDLLPIEWVIELEKLRSHKGTLPDGRKITWEKFSSMGNGFTFELETLIFYAIAISACEYEVGSPFVSVYGDDIIVPSPLAVKVIAALALAGFRTNTDKTFYEGPFRESCGAHWYNGTCIKPFYVRKKVDTVPRLIWLLNRLRAWAYDEETSSFCPLAMAVWKKYSKYIPRRLFGGLYPEDDRAVWSDHRPKDMLKFYSTTRRIDGYRALLTYFQGLHPGYEVVKFDTSVDTSSVSNLSKVSMNWCTIVPNSQWTG